MRRRYCFVGALSLTRAPLHCACIHVFFLCMRRAADWSLSSCCNSFMHKLSSGFRLLFRIVCLGRARIPLRLWAQMQILHNIAVHWEFPDHAIGLFVAFQS